MKYKLVVTDIDGTLVDNDKQISDVTMRYIDEFRAKGGLFTIATGRGERAARPFIENLKLDVPAIIFNGGELYHPETGALYAHYVDKKIFNLVIDWFKDTDLGIVTYHNDRIFISEYKPSHDLYMAQERVEVERIPDIKEVDEVNKILLVGDIGKARDLMKELEAKTGISINHVQTEDVYLEVLPEGISKGKGLIELCTYLDIPVEKTIAIGDHMNDIDMLKTAGCGIAMENATDEVKKVARYITRKNTENGVAHVLKQVMTFMV
ncbi:MAG: HAD family hydrolase [Thermoanaerobacteraceae bacterium]|nr:HAD family hydrolase [Thermoanaerobacteraceae bacterium]